MKVSRPLAVAVPSAGVAFAESVHATDFRMAERADAFHKLIYVLAGRVEYRAGRGRGPTVVPTGHLLIVPARLRHTIADLEPSTLLLLCAGEEFLHRDPELSALWEHLAGATGRELPLSRPARQRLETQWRQALLEQAHPRPGNGVTIRAIAAQVLVALARLPAQRIDDQAIQRVAAVTREVEETFFDEWNLDRAAQRAALSRRRFSELFRASQGTTFWEFLNELRLAHAACLLRAREHSVTGVMFSCGFNDLSHFYRLFRQRYGQPPKAWSAAAR